MSRLYAPELVKNTLHTLCDGMTLSLYSALLVSMGMSIGCDRNRTDTFGEEDHLNQERLLEIGNGEMLGG